MPLRPFKTITNTLQEMKESFIRFGQPALAELVEPLDSALPHLEVFCIASGMAGLLLMPEPRTVPGARVIVRAFSDKAYRVTRTRSGWASQRLDLDDTIQAVLEAVLDSGEWM